MSSSNCCFLICIQISQDADGSVILISLRIFQFVVIHTVKDFSVVSEAEVDIFSGIKVVFSDYLRLLIFLLAILIPACYSYSLALHMMYSAYKLNKRGDSIQPWHTAFPIWNQSIVPCPILTVVSWPASRFLRRQVRWPGIPISSRIFHSLLWSTQRLA